MQVTDITDCFGEYDIVGTKKNKQKIDYINKPVWSFDIETSSFYNDKGEKQSLMYIWQIGSEDKVYFGRTWKDFLETYNKIVAYYKTELNKRHLIIWVHNLSYEFQFIRKYFKWESVFAKEERKVMYALTKEGIEFRCSYMLSGLSLENTAKQCVKHKVEKKKGDLDYKLIRTPLTPLTKKELRYCEYDIICVNYYIDEQIDLYGKITDLPLTNTGRVRKVLREKAFTDVTKRKKTESLMSKLICQSTKELDMWNESFMGGFTHASSKKAGKTYLNVSSFDFTSSYPAVMLAEKYPMSKGKFIKNITIEEIIEGTLQNKGYIFRARFKNVVVKFDFEHFISYSKTHNCKAPMVDNGRLYGADEFEIVLTNVDYMTIEQCYDIEDIEVIEAFEYEMSYLPKYMIESVTEFYKNKTELKDIKGEYEETMYQLNKGMLNSCFGCSAQKLDIDEVFYETDWNNAGCDKIKCINDYNSNKNRVLFFPWAIFITAYARRNLWTGIIEFGEDYIYSDTDSIKCVNREKHMDYIEKYNKDIEEKISKCLEANRMDIELMRPKNIKGSKKQIGIWDYEGTYEAFKTLGSKRYMYMEDHEIHLTLAGVNKKSGAEYLCKDGKYLAFKNFDKYITFPKEYSGRLIHTYLDHEMDIDIVDYKGERYTGKELSGIHLSESDYNMELSDVYAKLIGLL